MQVVVREGRVWPGTSLVPGETVVIRAVVERPSWLSWLLGPRQVLRLAVRAPVSSVRVRYLRLRGGAPVRIRFDSPVQRVRLRWRGGSRTLRFPVPRASVDLGISASGADRSGVALVAAAARRWERLQTPIRIAWFPRDANAAAAIAEPAAGATLTPLQPIRITLSQPLARDFAADGPRVIPAVAGRWSAPDPRTLLFQPGGLGYPLGGRLTVELPQPLTVSAEATAAPAESLHWHVASGSTLRLQQLLARLRYLPLRWQRAQPVGASAVRQLAAALAPPTGRFSWRYWPPSPLAALWTPGRYDTLTRGAVMRFEAAHGLPADGIAGPLVWHALLSDRITGHRNSAGYSYVLVHRTIPQTLQLWHDGRIVYTTPVNTGVPAAPTQLGTYPVYLRLREQTMSGVNPDGSHYSDPGIRWISYFHGGDAIHGFQRPSYGTPQSVGCVELPVVAAARVWPLTPIGTLVTVEP